MSVIWFITILCRTVELMWLRHSDSSSHPASCLLIQHQNNLKSVYSLLSPSSGSHLEVAEDSRSQQWGSQRCYEWPTSSGTIFFNNVTWISSFFLVFMLFVYPVLQFYLFSNFCLFKFEGSLIGLDSLGLAFPPLWEILRGERLDFP